MCRHRQLWELRRLLCQWRVVKQRAQRERTLSALRARLEFLEAGDQLTLMANSLSKARAAAAEADADAVTADLVTKVHDGPAPQWNRTFAPAAEPAPDIDALFSLPSDLFANDFVKAVASPEKERGKDKGHVFAPPPAPANLIDVLARTEGQ